MAQLYWVTLQESSRYTSVRKCKWWFFLMILPKTDVSLRVCWWSLWGPGTNRWWHCQSLTGSAAPSPDESSTERGKSDFILTSKLKRRKHKAIKVALQWKMTTDQQFDTSMTCFLLDLSLEAHSTDPPRRSTVNSGFDWLLPNFWNQWTVLAWQKNAVTGPFCVNVKNT